MSIFVQLKKSLKTKLFITALCIATCNVYVHSASPVVGGSGTGTNVPIEVVQAYTGMQYLGITSDDRVQFLIDYWIGFEHIQEIWTSPCMTCPDFNNWLRQLKGFLNDMKSLAWMNVDPSLTVEGIIESGNHDFIGTGYPSEKWWNYLNQNLRPNDPLPWPGSNTSGTQNPGVAPEDIVVPGGDSGAESGSGESGSVEPGSGDVGKVESGEGSANNSQTESGKQEVKDTSSKADSDLLKDRLKNIAEMYTYSLLGEFIGHVTVGLYGEFSKAKDPVKLLDNWNSHTIVFNLNVLQDRDKLQVYKKVISAKNAVTKYINNLNVTNYLRTLISSLSNVFTLSLKDVAANVFGDKAFNFSIDKADNPLGDKVTEIYNSVQLIANAIYAWVYSIDVQTMKKLKINKRSLEVLKQETLNVMKKFVKRYNGKGVKFNPNRVAKQIKPFVDRHINELLNILETSKDYGPKLPTISVVNKIAKVVVTSFTKVSIVNGVTMLGKFVVNPAKFIKGVKADKDISSINAKVGAVSFGQGVFHFGTLMGASGAVGMVAIATGQPWLMIIPTCANVIIDFMVSKTNGATMMKKFLATVDESGMYNYEQQKILREFLKIASNKLNTVKNRIVSIGINKEVLGRMITKLFNILEGGEVVKRDKDGKEIGSSYVPSKILSSYYIASAFIKAIPEIYQAVKSEVNTNKNYLNKDAKSYKQMDKIHYLEDFIRVMTDMYQYMRYAGIMDEYYKNNYGEVAKESNTIMSKLKNALTGKKSIVDREVINKFLKSLYRFSDSAVNNGIADKNGDKKNNKQVSNSIYSVIDDIKSIGAKNTTKVLFKNLFNAFSIVTDSIKFNKYQKVTDIIPYIDAEKHIAKYTHETPIDVEKRERNLIIYLKREAKWLLETNTLRYKEMEKQRKLQANNNKKKVGINKRASKDIKL